MTGWWRFLYRTLGINYPENPSQETIRARSDCLKKIRDGNIILKPATTKEKSTTKKKKKKKAKKK